MQTHQNSQKIPMLLGIVALIAIIVGIMAIQMYFPEQTKANHSTGILIREVSNHHPPEPIINNQIPVPEKTNPGAIVSDIAPSIGMPVSGTERMISPQSQRVN